jgi:hypothetical protein
MGFVASNSFEATKRGRDFKKEMYNDNVVYIYANYLYVLLPAEPPL